MDIGYSTRINKLQGCWPIPPLSTSTAVLRTISLVARAVSLQPDAGSRWEEPRTAMHFARPAKRWPAVGQSFPWRFHQTSQTLISLIVEFKIEMHQQHSTTVVESKLRVLNLNRHFVFHWCNRCPFMYVAVDTIQRWECGMYATTDVKVFVADCWFRARGPAKKEESEGYLIQCRKWE